MLNDIFGWSMRPWESAPPINGQDRVGEVASAAGRLGRAVRKERVAGRGHHERRLEDSEFSAGAARFPDFPESPDTDANLCGRPEPRFAQPCEDS
jgi:hypothetical protein